MTGQRSSESAPSSARPGVLRLWATLGNPDNPPDRVAVVTCEHCGGLVALDAADRHARWHRSTGL